ncbi:MAG: hypothetical protein M5R36_28200 [Deltaproteobacteria bacterium]|nr:hypothetical protein [Deltaproteobacteria bacterium]
MLGREDRCPRSLWVAQVWAIKKAVRNVRIRSKGFPDEPVNEEQYREIVKHLLFECGNAYPQKTVLKKRLGLSSRQALNFDDKESTMIKGSVLGKILAEHVDHERLLADLPDELIDELSALLPVERDEMTDVKRKIADILTRIGVTDRRDELVEEIVRTPVPGGYLRFSKSHPDSLASRQRGLRRIQGHCKSAGTRRWNHHTNAFCP